jgi:hypothetical protein
MVIGSGFRLILKTKAYHIVGTFPQSNRTIIERGKYDTSNIHIHDTSNIQIHDTSNIQIHDTSNIQIHDVFVCHKCHAFVC